RPSLLVFGSRREPSKLSRDQQREHLVKVLSSYFPVKCLISAGADRRTTLHTSITIEHISDRMRNARRAIIANHHRRDVINSHYCIWTLITLSHMPSKTRTEASRSAKRGSCV